jgi:hypothetical protein
VSTVALTDQQQQQQHSPERWFCHDAGYQLPIESDAAHLRYASTVPLTCHACSHLLATDLPTHQRAPLTVTFDEECYWRGHDPQVGTSSVGKFFVRAPGGEMFSGGNCSWLWLHV